ncbi:NAD(P)/FAD-dependent oxidoreductase [Agrobacterium larrymoorei]|uniref:Oxidoreductase n=1 Tax=Agrobacterium larrymoorei TaxID=160699 RepID=A0A4D7E4I8_9HYPH|nr:FAD-dependent oxidoreductase [Agrobacterium larrymoorei]QCJ01083.1 oxidoreductase [Agrobacterium larrymoorei]QYA10100.1 FAD-dependent oxidoreductase [Agrobacterium larrymoorei]
MVISTTPRQPDQKRIAIVGASVAGVAAAEALSKGGFLGTVDVFDSETSLPYDRPPLSKQFALGTCNVEKLQFYDIEGWDRLGATLHLGLKVAAIEEKGRRLRLSDGRSFENDGLIIATGAEPINLKVLKGRENVISLRTLCDGQRLATALKSSRRLAIVGSGFIGLEVAAVAASLDIDVTVIERSPLPMEARLGKIVAKRILDLHQRHNINFLRGRTVASAEGGVKVETLVLDDGTRLDIDTVLVGIGVRPALAWLENSGIALSDGIVCDDHGRTNLSAVYAAGDAASWLNSLFNEQMRLEHWTTAREQGQHVAQCLIRELAGESSHEMVFDHVPYVWSDQYGLKIQTVGRFLPNDVFRIDHDEPENNRFAGSYWRNDKIRGAIAINMPKQLMSYRKEIISQYKGV